MIKRDKADSEVIEVENTNKSEEQKTEDIGGESIKENLILTLNEFSKSSVKRSSSISTIKKFEKTTNYSLSAIRHGEVLVPPRV